MMIDPWSVFTTDFGAMPKPFTALVTLLELAVYFAFILKVSKARGQYKIDAPVMDGPEGFLSVLRVQENTVEQLILHLPLLWIAAFAMDDIFAAAFGAVWVLGRLMYARGYYQKPKRRHKGFVIGTIVNAVLFVGALASLIASI